MKLASSRSRDSRHRRFLFHLALLLILVAWVAPLARAAWPPEEEEAQPGQPLPPSLSGVSLPKRFGRGYVPPKVDLSHLNGQWRLAPQSATVPIRWDWREQGMVTYVQDQGECGACYAFATLASMESQHLFQGQPEYDFSENNVIECNYEQTGCEGGNIWIVTNRLSRHGAVLESCDPYNPNDEPCNTSCPPVEIVSDMWALGGSEVPPVATLKNWLYSYGPLYVTMDSGSSSVSWYLTFQAYDGSYTLHYPIATPDLDHAVLLVGWDDNLPHAGGTGGWIVKNSWSTGWGGTCGYSTEGGYFTIAYDSAGIGSNAALIRSWQDYEPGSILLHHDEAGIQQAYGWHGHQQGYGLVRLTPQENGCASQVEFWTTDVTTDVDVYIYDSFNGQSPSGLLWQRENLSFDYTGYHSVAIDPPLPVSAGNDLNVVVRFTNASYWAVLPLDNLAPAAPSQSFVSFNGQNGTWSDLGATGKDVGIRLRVGLCEVTPTPTTAQPTSTTTPTVTPLTSTMTATPTSPGPTTTPTPSISLTAEPGSPTPTREPTSTTLRLPLVLRNHHRDFTTPTLVATPTATPTPTSTATAVPTLPTPTSTATALPTLPTPTSTVTAMPTLPPAPDCGDDFSDPDSGWPVVDDVRQRLEYVSGEYRFLVKAMHSAVFVRSDCHCTDCSVEVDGRFASPVYGAYGIMFGMTNELDGYLFRVNGNRSYSLRIRQGDHWHTLIDWTASPHVNPGQVPNHLRVVRQGSQISLFANGQHLTDISDVTFMGDLWVGLTASAYAVSMVDARFDNFAVYILSGSSEVGRVTKKNSVPTSYGVAERW